MVVVGCCFVVGFVSCLLFVGLLFFGGCGVMAGCWSLWLFIIGSCHVYALFVVR